MAVIEHAKSMQKPIISKFACIASSWTVAGLYPPLVKRNGRTDSLDRKQKVQVAEQAELKMLKSQL